MFIRALDGGCTDNKSSAMLFNTVDEAKAYVTGWRESSYVVGKSSLQLSIIEVETKHIISKIGKEIEII
jgi:hypothetical protein